MAAETRPKRQHGVCPATAGVLAVVAFGQILAEPQPLGAGELVPLPRPNPILQTTNPVKGLIDGASETSQALSYSPETAHQPASVIPPSGSPTKVVVRRSILAEAAFKIAVKLFDNGDPNAALVAGYALPDSIDSKIIKWLVAVYKYKEVPAARIDAISKELADWPGQRLLRIRFEQALELQKPSPAEVIAAFAGNTPVSDDGTVLLIRAYVATGKNAQAAALIRERWREEPLDDGFETTIREEFGDLLTKTDCKIRMDHMLYAGNTAKALRAAADLDDAQQALAKAVAQVVKGSPKAGDALDRLPRSVQNDPIVIYSHIQFLRRMEKFEAAATLMLSAPRDPSVLVDPDAWWVERRLLARALILKHDYRTAYRIAAGHTAQTAAMRADAEFHAGWIALEFLNDPEAARRHFAVIQAISTRPLSQSRAEYWLGRAAAAAGDTVEAKQQFLRAAAYPTTFYGQLALARLGATAVPLTPFPTPDSAALRRFNDLELVQVIHRLSEIKKDDRNDIFFDYLADTITDPMQIALLTEMAEYEGDFNLSLRIGKSAANRGLPVDVLAFPTSAIPSSTEIDEVEPALVYAIARQESAFHAGAVSPAGARGLLQLMPGTAKQMAKKVGIGYSKSKLTTDPAYNTMLGSHFLKHLLERFNGSYVLTFAAYNAGPTNVAGWIESNGDPRDPKVDVIDWIELIPFAETRNYVQRIIESLEVYRARLGSPALTIESDLRRGASG